MAKKSAADIKAEAAEINDYIAKARKRAMNFALVIAKDGVILEAHPTKGPDVMRRQAKAKGGMPKGTQGVMNVSGKVMELTCEDDDFPPNLGKTAKKYFSDLGISMRVILVGPSGQASGDDDGDDDAPEDAKPAKTAPKGADGAAASDPAKTETEEKPDDDDGDENARNDLKKRAEDLEKELKKAASNIGDAAAALGDALGGFLKSGINDKIEIAKNTLDEIQKKLEEAKKTTGGVSPDALRDALSQEFAEIEDKIGLLIENGQKGVSKKAEQLSEMFKKEAAGDLKKAGAVLSLLKTFVQTETSKLEKAGDAVGQGAKAAGETLSGMADGVAKGVDGILDGAKKGVGEAKKTAKGVFGKVGKSLKGIFGKVGDAANGVSRASAKVAGKLAQVAGSASAIAQAAAETAGAAVEGAGKAVGDAATHADHAIAQVGDGAADLAKQAKVAVDAAEKVAKTAARDAEAAARQAAAAAARAAAIAQAAAGEADEKAAKAAEAAADTARKLAEVAKATAEMAAKQATDAVKQVEAASQAAIDSAQRAADAAETKARGLLGGISDMISRLAGGAEDGAEGLIGQARNVFQQVSDVATQAAERAGSIGEAAQETVRDVQAQAEAKIDEAIAAVTAIAQRMADAAQDAATAATDAANLARGLADDVMGRAQDVANKVDTLAQEAGTAAADLARQASNAAHAAAQAAEEAAKDAEEAAARAREAAQRLVNGVGRAADGVLDRASEEAVRVAQDAADQARAAAEAAANDATAKVADAQRLVDRVLADAQAEADRKIKEAQDLFNSVTNPFERAADAVGDEARDLLAQANAAGGAVIDAFSGLLGTLGRAGGKIQDAAAQAAEAFRRQAQQGVDTAIDAIERTRLEIEARVNSKIARIEARAEKIASEALRRAEEAKAEAEALARQAEDALAAGEDLAADALRLATDAALAAGGVATAAAVEAAASAAAIRAAIKAMKDEARETVEDFLEDFSEDAIEAAENAANEAARKAEAALNDVRARADEVRREAEAAQRAVEAEIERKKAEADALLAQVETAATGILGHLGDFVNGATDSVEDNAKRLADLEKKVLGGVTNAGGALFKGLRALFEDRKNKVEKVVGGIADAIKDAIFGQQKSVQEFRAEAVAELAKIEAAIAEGERLSLEVFDGYTGFQDKVGSTLAAEAVAQHKGLTDARANAMNDSRFCVNDTNIWINDIDRALITLEDIIRNKVDPSQGTIEQTNAQRAVEGIRLETAKAEAYQAAAIAEHDALMKVFATDAKMFEDSVKDIVDTAKSIERDLEAALVQAENASEPAEIKALKDTALKLGIAMDTVMLQVNSYGGELAAECMKTLTPIAEHIDDLKQAVLRLEALAEVAEEEEEDKDQLGADPTDDDDAAPAEEGGTDTPGADAPSAAPAGEIAEAVGTGAPNAPADVNTIKSLLADFASLLKFAKLPMDGKAEKAFIDQIRQFQSLVCKIRADGVISPGKTTFKALKAGPGAVTDEFPTGREDGDTTEYPPNVTGDTAGVKDHIINVLEEVSSFYKGAKIHVTSGLRDADDQARVMWKYWTTNLKNGEIYGYLKRNRDILTALQGHYKAGEEAAFKKIIVEHAASLSDHLYGRAVDVPINTNPKIVAAISSVLRKVVEKSCIHFDDRDRNVPAKLDPSVKDKWPK